ncbi:kelch-like protein 26 isoform X2 [Sitophilus oryzae]|uniref:Kelch-like protein 26 isoform X2 n=1 Tax=Sitophilus oryzae TaxID=7048 RepID=A0A6J2XMY1_SITOR|nr:kelch-like protein 26 isoform X2 [Sitophilus oryzae]
MENKKEIVTFDIEGSAVECDKELLIKNSDYFSAMFKGYFKESSENNIKLQGVDLKAFNLIMLILWEESDIVTLDLNETYLLLEAACMLQFNSIKQLCEERIMIVLSPSTSLRTWKTAELLDIIPLYLKAKCMALENFMEICESDSILELNLEELCQYLGHIYLNSHKEFIVFQTAMSWFYENQNQSENINPTKVVLKLLSCINFNALNVGEITEMKTYPNISENAEIQMILNCIINLRNNRCTDVVDEFDRDVVSTAVHLCGAKNRKISVKPCILLQSMHPTHTPQSSRITTIVIYDSLTDTFKHFFPLEEKKVEHIEGFKLVRYKHFIFFFGGQHLRGSNEWNLNLWSFDTFKNKWERRNKLPHGRRHFETCIVGDSLYIVGGTGRFRVLQNNLLHCDLKTGKWSSEIINLPKDSREYQCCSFLGQLCILYVNHGTVYTFNIADSSWQSFKIAVEEEVVNSLGKYTVFADSTYIYIKGRKLLRLKFENNSFVLDKQKDVRLSEWIEIQCVQCNNLVYTIYKCFDEKYEFCYTLEEMNLDTDEIRNIFENKIAETDPVVVDKKTFYIRANTTQLFSTASYQYVKENIFVNDFL